MTDLEAGFRQILSADAGDSGQVVHVVSTPCPLGPAERQALDESGWRLPARLAQAVASRQQEFMAGRYCALEALARAGASRTGRQAMLEVLEIREDRSAAWPQGFVGSIAHSDGWAAAAVASSRCVASLGIDFEPWIAPERAEALSPRIVAVRERELLRARAGGSWSDHELLTLAFSAKESIYKCLRPLAGEFFGFEDAELTDASWPEGVFAFELKRPLGQRFASGWRGTGRFERRKGRVFTAMVLAHPYAR